MPPNIPIDEESLVEGAQRLALGLVQPPVRLTGSGLTRPHSYVLLFPPPKGLITKTPAPGLAATRSLSWWAPKSQPRP